MLPAADMLVHGFCISEMSGSTFHVIVSFYVPVGIYSVIFLSFCKWEMFKFLK
ncbi:hypothetical protein BGW80DRAFT_1309380 [Lactifluus volemus]|nr:hypothetical protein BGW80DRAFT_1309380 [Lactifluus volemus]